MCLRYESVTTVWLFHSVTILSHFFPPLLVDVQAALPFIYVYEKEVSMGILLIVSLCT